MAKIRRSQFARQHKHHSVSINIRLHKDGGDKPTRADVERVLRQIMNTGRVPAGWKFNAIDWRRPGWSSGYWREGNVSDITGSLSQVINVILDDKQKTRVGIVRGTLYEIEIGIKY